STYFFIKQTASVIIALAAFTALALTPYTLLKKYATKILLFGFAACVLLAFAGWFGLAIAQCSLGACRWFSLGPLGTLQPAEILKFGLLVFTAGFLGMRAKQGLVNDLDKTLIPLGAIILPAVVLVIGIQRDMGTGIAMLALLASMIMVAGISKKIGGMLLIGAVIMGILLIVIAPHRIERVTTFLAGDTTMVSGDADANYHINHAKTAIGTGGLFGVGIGNSVQATGYLPEAINDSVFAIMGETFGFIGLTVILLIFTALLMRLLKITDHLPDMWMKLVVAGVFGWLASHVILNVAAMIGVFPLTGITLPLLSFGGTSMIFIAGALGLAFQLSRYTAHGTTNKETSYEDTSSRRGIGRPRYAGRRSTTRT
ncbi:MAG TPA: FtsW/RodA/SpoVE family cell cycle protein, partial [Candidatus Saccharimonadales bacterium]|nr:FtsW/RodA/SpoVE family cell cycle protein [Candidatus Saccharimonadales bacterium]